MTQEVWSNLKPTPGRFQAVKSKASTRLESGRGIEPNNAHRQDTLYFLRTQRRSEKTATCSLLLIFLVWNFYGWDKKVTTESFAAGLSRLRAWLDNEGAGAAYEDEGYEAFADDSNWHDLSWLDYPANADVWLRGMVLAKERDPSVKKLVDTWLKRWLYDSPYDVDFGTLQGRNHGKPEAESRTWVLRRLRNSAAFGLVAARGYSLGVTRLGILGVNRIGQLINERLFPQAKKPSCDARICDWTFACAMVLSCRHVTHGVQDFGGGVAWDMLFALLESECANKGGVRLDKGSRTLVRCTIEHVKSGEPDLTSKERLPLLCRDVQWAKEVSQLGQDRLERDSAWKTPPGSPGVAEGDDTAEDSQVSDRVELG